jgi:peroxiredoxin
MTSRLAIAAIAAILLATLPLAAAEPRIETIALGAAAPAFDLSATDGRNYTLESFKESKIVAVVFTANHCPEAVAAWPKVEALFKDYKDKGVAVVAISGNDDKALRADELGFSVWGDSFAEMKAFMEETKYSFPYLYDGETQKATTAYGAQATPHVFVLDAQRKVRYAGRIDDAKRSSENIGTPYVREAIDALLAGREVAEASTRAFGCSTKWSWKRDSVIKDNEEWAKREVTLAELDAELAKKLAANETGKVRLINFWSTTCAPCLEEFPELVETYRRFQNRPIELITITTDPANSRKRAEAFLKKSHAALANNTRESLAKEGRATNNYIFTGANLDHLAEAIDPEWSGAQPHTVLIAPGGKILWRHTNSLDFIELRRQIVKALEGK